MGTNRFIQGIQMLKNHVKMGKWKKVVILVQIDICWYLNRPIANTMQVVQLDEHPGIEEKLCRYKSMKRVKNKTPNVVAAFGIYQWRKTSAPSTSSLGPWIYLWSYSATLTTGFKSSAIAVLFSVTLCLELFLQGERDCSWNHGKHALSWESLFGNCGKAEVTGQAPICYTSYCFKVFNC